MNAQNEFKEPAREVAGWLDLVRRHVDSIRFGVVQIIVHDSQVTQIDKTERIRLEKTKTL